MNGKYIAHFGVRGMRWGVRRSKSNVIALPGPVSSSTKSNGTKKNKKPLSDDDLIKIKGGLETGVKLANKGSEINKQIGKAQASKKKEMDLGNMTDAELKATVSRLNLETQYRKLKSDELSKGQIDIETTLSIAGGVLAVGATALSIAMEIKRMKGGAV